MPESLRARLLLWYTSILVAVILAFGTAVCYLYWRSMVTRLDEELRRQAQTIGAALHPTSDAAFDLDLPEESASYFQVRGASAGRYYVIWNEAGQHVDRSDPDIYVPLIDAPASRNRMGMREVAVRAAGTATVLVGRETSDLYRDVWLLGGTVAGTALAALGLSLVGGWFLARGTLAPIVRISRTAEAMAQGDLTARIAVDRTETELGRLGVVLNQAFDRLHEAIERQRRFTADASHELRTPLSTLLLEVDWALARDRGPGEYRETLDACRRAGSRMRGVVEGLLRLARADAGDLVLHRVPVALDEVATDVVGLLRPLADTRKVALAVSGHGATVVGDPELLREVVTNLVSNAIHYNRDEGRVDVTVWQGAPSACIQVTDNGIGISPEDLPRVFERFYRADKARSRDVGGSGLGLAVTRWIVERHGGEITCASESGRGTSFLVRLPRHDVSKAPSAA